MRAAYSLLGGTTAQTGPDLTVTGSAGVSVGLPTPFSDVPQARPVLVGTGEPGASVALFDNGNPLGSTVVRADGTWSFQATGITTGSHSITARQTDRAGNASALSSAYSFTVDSSRLGRPTLAVASDSGLQADGLTNVTAPTLSGSGVSAGATIEVYDDGVRLGNATVTGSNWTFTPSSPLFPGSHNITVREIVGGNVARTSDALSLRIDTTAAAPTVNAIGANSRVAPVVTGTAEAGASVTLSAVSSDGTSTFTTTANASGVWSVDTGAGASALVANKAYTLRAVQTDVAGNTSVASTAQTLNFDTLVAAPTITSPVNASTTAPSLTVTGTGEVGATVRVYEGGVLLGSTTVNALGGWSLAVSGLASGSRSLRAEQVDLAGNLSALSAAQTITVSSTAVGAPVLAVASDSGVLGDGITNSTTPTFSGTAAANATVELWDTFNGSSVRVGTATANASGAWTLTLPTQAQGAHSYVARELGSDGLPAAGRSSAATALTIDTTAPAVAPTLVLATASDSGASNSDGITNVNLPTLRGQAEAGATVQISRGGSPVATVTADASTGAWSWTASAALADGSHSFTARQLDAAGNLSPASAALNLTIDTVAAPSVLGVYDGMRIDSAVGTTSRVTATAIQLNRGNTLSFWAKLDAANMNSSSIQQLFSSVEIGELVYQNGTLLAWAGTGGFQAVNMQADANWHNYVVVSTGTSIALYVDGVQRTIGGANTLTATNGYGGTLAFRSTELTLGNHPSIARSLSGVMADVQLWD